jgi:methyl-accepting chemotaxis protein
MNKNKRRNIFIKKDFQGKLILGYFLFVLGGILFFIMVMTIFSADTLTISYADQELQLGQTPFMILRKTLAANWLFIVFGTAFLLLAAMLITHRIAGPLFRFERALDQMLQKNLNDTIHLRAKDEGKDLAQKINMFNAELSVNIRLIRTQSEAIHTLVTQKRARLDNQANEQMEEMASLLWTIEEKNKRIGAICASYSLKHE